MVATSENRVDLHCHSAISDGNLQPQELVARAAQLGLKVVSVTDHDTTGGVPAALAEADRWGITVVPGVEISAVSRQEEIHILGYFVSIEDPALQSLLARSQQTRLERAQQMLTRLANLGLSIEWERLLAISGGTQCIGRPHVAASLVEAGYVRDWDEAFDLWIGRGRPAYVERHKILPEEACAVVRGSGGVPVLAHPYFFSRDGEYRAGLDLKRWLPRLRKAGLSGIEVYYPNYPRQASCRLLDLAIEHGLLITGGSDYHGGLVGTGLGAVAVPWAAWEGLERRHQSILRRQAL